MRENAPVGFLALIILSTDVRLLQRHSSGNNGTNGKPIIFVLLVRYYLLYHTEQSNHIRQSTQ